MKYYFTQGSGGENPYNKGWVEVIADDYETAIEKYKTKYPNPRNKALVNCAFIYNEAIFKDTKMFTHGNFGVFCHDVIA